VPRRSLSLAAHRDFRLLLLGQTTSQFGTQISGVAIPLLAVLTLHASAFQVGLIGAASTISFAVIGLPAGAWLDRRPRRRFLIGSDVARAVLLASIPVAGLLGVLSLAQVIVVALLAGFARVFFDVGYQSYIPTVIGTERVLAGNSAMEFLRSSGQVAGPGIGGLLISLVGAANVVLLDALTFAVSAGTLLAIRTREPERATDAGSGHLGHRILEGLSFVLRNRVLLAIAIASAVSNFVFAVASAVTMIFLSRTLGLSAVGIGLVIAAGSAATMAGAAAVSRLARAVGSVRVIWLSLAVTVPQVLVAFAQPGLLVLLFVAGSAAGEFGQIVYAISNVSLRQRLCPDHVLSRVNATMGVLIMGLFPLGALIGGLSGELIGPRLTLLGAGVLLTAAPLTLYGVLRGHRDVESLPPWGPSTDPRL
jgi:MFS family permease